MRTLTDSEKAEFELWWQDHGQFCRAGGGPYEKTFAYHAWETALARAGQRTPLSEEAMKLLIADWAVNWQLYGYGAIQGYTRAVERAHGITQDAAQVPPLSGQASAEPEASLGTQYWLAKLDSYGNPTLLDGAHGAPEGVRKAAFLFKALRIGQLADRHALAKVELFEVKPSDAGVNHEAIATCSQAALAAPKPAAPAEISASQAALQARLAKALEALESALKTAKFERHPFRTWQLEAVEALALSGIQVDYPGVSDAATNSAG